jgi:integrase
VVRRKTKTGLVFALRFYAYGERHYLTLGAEEAGWSRSRAEEELQNVMADVRRGIWVPPVRCDSKSSTEDETGKPGDPNFHRFASDWLAGRKGEISERGIEYYTWALTHHLLPFFAGWRLSEITVEAVDAYRQFKIRQSEERRAALDRGRPKLPRTESPARPLSPATINKTIDVLQAVMALAVEYGHIDRNPASGRRRRLKVPPRASAYLDSVEQIEALLEGAHRLDNQPGARTSGRHALISTLLLAGLRAGEACALRWRDVDLANGRIYVGQSKTQAGLREVTLLPLLRDILATHKAAAATADPDAPVFVSASGKARDRDNLRNRVLDPALREADKILTGGGHPPIAGRITPHKLRHTFASILVACGEDPASVMAQIGHTDPKFTLRIYTHLMRRDEAERTRLEALVFGAASARMTSDPRHPQQMAVAPESHGAPKPTTGEAEGVSLQPQLKGDDL